MNTTSPYQAVLFDFDGTLLDTLADLASATNRVLAHRGYPTHDIDAYRWFIGDGSAMLMERAMPADQRTPENIASCLGSLLADYNQNWHHATRIYDGIGQLLATLQDRKIAMAVVTNKPHPFAEIMIAHYFRQVPFGSVWSQREGIPKKPDPYMALQAAAELKVQPARCLFLGDSGVDMHTARAAGMLAVGAGWGFRPRRELLDAGAAHVVDHPLKVLDIF